MKIFNDKSLINFDLFSDLSETEFRNSIFRAIDSLAIDYDDADAHSNARTDPDVLQNNSLK